MTDNNHPITPPDELVEDLWEATQKEKPEKWVRHLATQSARWGADMELEACCKWLKKGWIPPGISSDLRTARRPKPPSLKEQALEAAYRFYANNGHDNYNEKEIKDDFDIICRALESLQELEGQGDG